jgi:hypothetical protein
MSTENQLGNTGSRNESAGSAGPPQQPVIRIGKSQVPAEVDSRTTVVDIFTMALGEEAIYLLPLKTWSQLDIHKWRVQGKLPGTPAGLEITADRVKIAGESVWTTDPEGCAKLEKAFNDWLTLEWQAVEQAKQKAQTPAGQPPTAPPEEESLRFHVELDKAGQPHIHCLEGKETPANVACTVPGITSLINAGLMLKPASWKVGALRDWLELDGQLFRFKNENDIAELEQVLNERYHPAGAGGAAQEVKVFVNPASESGFDIQFPAIDGGLMETRRRHLDTEAIELLSDPQRCRVLRKGVVVRFVPPSFHFKQKMPDGGERELDAGPENVVSVVGEDGQHKWIDLSERFSHAGLGAAELTAIFNHPSITRRVRRGDQADRTGGFEQAA